MEPVKLDIFATQTALAVERAVAATAARDAELRAQTEQMRSSLLSAVSHDLRTPLASITGAATSLLSQSEHLAPATQRELLESIAEEAGRLERLVNNLLEITRLESGGVELHRDGHPLEEIAGAALTRLEPSLAQRPVITSFPADLPLVLVGDVLLTQLFVNLVENAVKYSPPRSPIEIAARSDRDEIVIEVKDRGSGFAAGDERRVFEKFYRGKGMDARGAGLGLAICRAIVLAHSGSIAAENRPGGGAVLRIRLPAGRQVPEAAAYAERS